MVVSTSPRNTILINQCGIFWSCKFSASPKERKGTLGVKATTLRHFRQSGWCVEEIDLWATGPCST